MAQFVLGALTLAIGTFWGIAIANAAHKTANENVKKEDV